MDLSDKRWLDDPEMQLLLNTYGGGRAPASTQAHPAQKAYGSKLGEIVDSGLVQSKDTKTSTRINALPAVLSGPDAAKIGAAGTAAANQIQPIQDMGRELASWKTKLDSYVAKKEQDHSGLEEAAPYLLKFGDMMSNGKYNLSSLAPTRQPKEDPELQALKAYGDVLGNYGRLGGLYTKLGGTATNSGGDKETTTAVNEKNDAPPVTLRPPGGPKDTSEKEEQRQSEKAAEATAEVEDAIRQAKRVQELLPKVKDLDEMSTSEKGKTFIYDAVNNAVGSNLALTSEQQEYDQLKKDFAFRKQLVQSGRASSDKEFKRITTQFGAMPFSNKKQITTAINWLLAELEAKVKRTKNTFPKARPNVIPKEKDIRDATVTPKPYVPATAPPKKNRSKMTDAELEAELKLRGL